MSSFKKSNVSRVAQLASLREKLHESSNPKGNFQRQDDERLWKPELDKTGTGSAVIHFLPGREGDAVPYATLHTHGFQGPSGKWFIENCPTSIGQECPACKANSELWNSGRDEDKNVARSRKRKLNYISNILVVKDAKHPENEGKVFLYKYGKKIFEKIKDQMCPPDSFELEPVNPFDPFEGANFNLRIMKQDGFPNYDKSSFAAVAPIFGGNEDKIAGLETQVHSLEAVVAPKEFKSYDELQKRLNGVLTGANESSSARRTSVAVDEEEEVVIAPRQRAAAPKAVPAARPKPQTVAASDDEDEDYFAKLAQGDE